MGQTTCLGVLSVGIADAEAQNAGNAGPKKLSQCDLCALRRYDCADASDERVCDHLWGCWTNETEIAEHNRKYREVDKEIKELEGETGNTE